MPCIHCCPEDSRDKDSSDLTTVYVNSETREMEEWCESCVTDSTFRCERCDNAFSDDVEHHHVHTNPNRLRETQVWCPRCTDRHAFTCESSNEEFSDDFTLVEVDGRGVCLEMNSDELYYWQSDEEYHWEPEPEEDCQDSDGLYGYHEGPRPWFGTDIPEFAMGVELEMYSEDRSTLVDYAKDRGLIPECDGSLHSSYGVEIIGPPMMLKDYYKQDGAWFKFIHRAVEIGAKGWRAGTGYGIHVNLNRRGITRLHQGKIQYFIHNNETQCAVIAGRNSSNWAEYRKKSRVCPDSLTKYDAVNLSSRGRIEVRIFRSTLKWESFLKNVEFVDAVRVFTKDTPARDLNWTSFCRCVRKYGRNAWPNLRKFMIDKAIMENA